MQLNVLVGSYCYDKVKYIQSTPDNSNLQRMSKIVRVIRRYKVVLK